MSRALAAGLALLVVVATVAPGRAAEPPVVNVTLDPRVLTVGDPVTAALELVVAGDGSQVVFPDWSEGWGEAEVLAVGPVERTVVGGAVRLRQVLELTAFRPGRIALPARSVRLAPEDASASTPDTLELEVRSVLPPDDPEVAPLPPEPPRPLAVPASVTWTIAALAAAIVAAALVASRRTRARAPKPEAPPLAELLASLASLAADAPEPGHAKLSSALRRFLGRSLEFPAVESSTREVERALSARHLDPALVQRTTRLLRESDRIKFARRSATSDELRHRAGEARAIGEEVEAHLHPASLEAGKPEAAA